MPINFPSSPTSGSQYTYGSKTWQWNGYAWDIVTPTTISTFNGCTSSAITITGTANEVTVDTTCPNIVIGLPNNLVVQNLTVTGSLLVSGGITTQMSEVVLIEDNFVTLNANVTAGTPTENAGIIISRGASANVDLRWNETSDNWQFTNNGTDYWNLPINVVNTFNGLTGAVSFDVPVASASVTGVASFGNQFVVSAAGAVSLTSNYVASMNGETGAITNVAKTNVAQTFTATQSFVAGLTAAGITVDGTLSLDKRPYTLLGADTNIVNGVPDLLLQGATSNYASRIAINGYSLDGTTGGIDLVPYSGNVYIKQGNYADGDLVPSTNQFASLHLQAINGFGTVRYGIITVPGTLSANRTLTIPDATGVIALTNQIPSVVLASASVTGVASFNATRFTVSATGAVDLSSAFQVTGDTVVGGTAITATRSGNSVTIDNNGVRSFNGSTGAVTFAVPVASASATGVASFGNQFVVSAAGAVSLTSNYVASVNGSTGAITNVARTNVAQTFSELQTFSSGISAAGGITFNSNVTINSANTLIASTIQSEVGKNQLDIANTSNSRVAIGDIDGNANSTFIFLRDATSVLDISNPYSLINIGDTSNINTGAYISYEAPAGELNGNGSSIVNFNNASFINTVSAGGLLTASAGITAQSLFVSQGATFASRIQGVGATFTGTVEVDTGLILPNNQNITSAVTTFNGLSGAVTLTSGSNITLTPSGNIITIASGGGFTRSIFTITTSTTAGSTASTDYVYIGATSDNINLTLPTAAGNTNRYTVKNSNIGTLTILTTSSQTIDGATAYALTKQYQAIDLLSDNTNWIVA